MFIIIHTIHHSSPDINLCYPIYLGICSNGLAKCSEQNGNLLAVQISVSCFLLAIVFEETRQATYRLQGLLDLGVESTGLEGDNRGRSLGVMGDGRTALAAEDTVDGLAGRAIAGVGLGRTVQLQKVLGDDGDEGCRSLVFIPNKVKEK